MGGSPCHARVSVHPAESRSKMRVHNSAWTRQRSMQHLIPNLVENFDSLGYFFKSPVDFGLQLAIGPHMNPNCTLSSLVPSDTVIQRAATAW